MKLNKVGLQIISYFIEFYNYFESFLLKWLQNLKIIKNQFNKAKADFEKLEKKAKDLTFKSFEEFLAE